MDKEKTDIFIVGGGPAGMMAAISARKANPSAKILLIEKNEKLGKKLFITGKGRGNLTNTCEEARFLEHVLSNPRFLYPAFHAFNNMDLMRFIEGLACPLKEERGGRVFPKSDKAYSITDALKRALKKAEVSVECNRTLKAIKRREEGFLCNVGGKELFCKKLILATGGLSYPSTGSTGDGYHFAKALSIPVTACYPSLVKLEVLSEDIYALSGLKLKNVVVSVLDEKRKLYGKKSGEVYFQKDAVAGPTILSLSAELSPLLNQAEIGKFTVLIDLKGEVPAFDADFLLECEKRGKEPMKALIKAHLPQQLFPLLCRRLEKQGIPVEKRASECKKKERKKVLSAFHELSFPISGTGSFTEAIVTKGGIDTRALSKKSLEVKAVPGLYFAGEVLDVDAYTGGFNMQIAFSTGFLAGKSAGEALL